MKYGMIITKQINEVCKGIELRESTKLVYHYTSLEGLTGILNDGNVTFRFSRYDALNDKSEGVDILEIYREVINDLFDKKEIDESLYDAIRDISVEDQYQYLFCFPRYDANDEYETDEILDVSAGKAYVCSFSKSRDSLPMWNYYSKGDDVGYNIGGQLLPLLEESCFEDSAFKGTIMKIYSVIYKDEEKKKLIRNVIERIQTELCSVSPEEMDTARLESRRALCDFLNRIRFAFKKDCFEYEQEYRMVIIVPDKEFPGKADRFSIKYRNVNSFLVPFFDLKADLFIPLYVGIGPFEASKGEKEARKKVLSEKLAKNGIREDDIWCSEIPIRY